MNDGYVTLPVDMQRYSLGDDECPRYNGQDRNRPVSSTCRSESLGSSLERSNDETATLLFKTNRAGELTVLMLVIGFIIALNASFGTNVNPTRDSESIIEKNGNAKEIFLRTRNTYGYTNLWNSTMDYPYLREALLFEPYRQTIVEIDDPRDDCVYQWKFEGVNFDDYDISGVSVNGTFDVSAQRVGQYSFSVDEVCNDGDVTSRTYTKDAWVKYVRRELSALNDEDREAFLDAFYTLWNVSTNDGVQKFGDLYKSLYYFAVIHNDAGGNPVCDEFHGGIGFIANHMLLSAYLEQSLQLVNPRTCLHYMEYSKYFESREFKGHLTNQLDFGTWTEIFTSKFFGSSDPVSGRILDGRWANVTIPTINEEFLINHGIDSNETFFPVEESPWVSVTKAHISSPYGLLRAPWNWNPDAHVTRYHNVYNIPDIKYYVHHSPPYSYFDGVKCDDLIVFVNESVVGKPLESFLLAVEDETHGKVHMTFGGFGGRQALSKNAELMELGISEECIGESALASQKFMKYYKYANDSSFGTVVNCSVASLLDSAVDSDLSSNSPCSCNDDFFETEDSLGYLLDLWNEFENFGNGSCKQELSLISFENRKKAMQLICSRLTFDGDLAGSGAATDPLFWVVHGAVDKLFQYSVLQSVLTDLEYPDLTSHKDFCSGHYAGSSKSWLKGLRLMNESIDISSWTNEDLMDILIPTSDVHRDLLPYVYDSANYYWCESFDDYYKV